MKFLEMVNLVKYGQCECEILSGKLKFVCESERESERE